MKDPDKMSKRELRAETKALRTLLKDAKCADDDCDEGIIHRQEDWDHCQWCWNRAELIGDGD